jgi:hypothetical protein
MPGGFDDPGSGETDSLTDTLEKASRLQTHMRRQFWFLVTDFRLRGALRERAGSTSVVFVNSAGA